MIAFSKNLSLTAYMNPFQFISHIKKLLSSLQTGIPIPIPVIVINGRTGSGKDIFVDIMKAKFTTGLLPGFVKNTPDGKSERIIIENFSSIDPIRDIPKVVSQYDRGLRSDFYRTFIYDIKQAWIKYDPLGPTKYLINQLVQCTERYGDIFSVKDAPMTCIFVHIREKDEIRKFLNELDLLNRNMFGLIRFFPYKLLVTDPTHRFGTSAISNPSDDIDMIEREINYDITVNNDKSIEYLEDDAVNCMSQIFYNIMHEYDSLCITKLADTDDTHA